MKKLKLSWAGRPMQILHSVTGHDTRVRTDFDFEAHHQSCATAPGTWEKSRYSVAAGSSSESSRRNCERWKLLFAPIHLCTVTFLSLGDSAGRSSEDPHDRLGRGRRRPPGTLFVVLVVFILVNQERGEAVVEPRLVHRQAEGAMADAP